MLAFGFAAKTSTEMVSIRAINRKLFGSGGVKLHRDVCPRGAQISALTPTDFPDGWEV